MTDDPMDQIEMRQALKNRAGLVRCFHLELIAEGFTELEALRISTAWMIEALRNGKNASE